MNHSKTFHIIAWNASFVYVATVNVCQHSKKVQNENTNVYSRYFIQKSFRKKKLKKSLKKVTIIIIISLLANSTNFKNFD